MLRRQRAVRKLCSALARIGLIAAPVQLLGRWTELDDEIAGQVLRRFDHTQIGRKRSRSYLGSFCAG